MSDIREALQAAMDGVEDTSVETTDIAKQEPSEVIDDAGSDRPRDERGRFAPKQAEAPEAERQQEAPAAVGPVQQEAQPAVEAKAPPKSWRKEYHEHWSQLPPAVQDYTLQREDEYYRGIGSYRQSAEQWQQFMEAARPYEATFRAMEMSPVQAFQRLANADYVLRTSDMATRANMLANLAQSYGVDLSQLQNPPQVDPQFQQLHGTVRQLEQRLQQQQQMYDELQRSLIQPQLEQMASKPHFDDLRPEMAQLLNAGFASTLEEAYNKALRMSPYFEETLTLQRQESERARLQGAAQAAAKAKSAAVQVKGSPSTVLAGDKRDMRSQLESAFDEHIR